VEAVEGAAGEAWPPAGQGGWQTFAGYVAAGFGLFVLGSLLVAWLFPKITIWASLTVYGVNFTCFAGLAYVFGVWRPRRTWADFGLRPFDPRWLRPALVVALAFIPLRAAAALLAEAALGSGLSDGQGRLDLVAPEGPLAVNFALSLLGAGLLVPLAEELVFRGLLHGWLRGRLALWPAVAASSALFALGHFDSVAAMASTFVMGVVCAVALERGRSLWLPVAIHVVNNSLAVVLVYGALALG
jgi:membrane protease YdiL (CAAX protease family)